MNKNINAILVDDEPHCIENLRYYLDANCPRIHIVGTGEQPECAEKLLDNLEVDVAFFDIHLFDRNLLDWLSQSGRNIPVVFVTAYEHYALHAFRVQVVDYLLKPLETSEIKRCYNKIIHFLDGTPVAPAPAARTVTLRQADHVFVVALHDIVMLKAGGFYTTVYFEQEGKLRSVLVAKPINLVCSEYNEPSLMRVHRSYAVNMKRISAIRKTATGVFLETVCGEVPVAKKRKADFFGSYHV